MSSGSGYAGRHRDPVPPAAVAAATGWSHQTAWLLGAAVGAVLILFGVLAYPSLIDSVAPRSGQRTASSSASGPGLDLLGQQETTGTRTDGATRTPAGQIFPTAQPPSARLGPAAATADPPSGPPTSEPTTDITGSTTTSSAASTPPATGTVSTSTAPSTTTTPAKSSPTSSASPADNARAVAQALFSEFGFSGNEFGCLNAAWNRLGLWSTASAVRPGLIYLKGRYGTPCVAWDHVRKTGNY